MSCVFYYQKTTTIPSPPITKPKKRTRQFITVYKYCESAREGGVDSCRKNQQF